MSEISREEIIAYTEAQNKTAVALDKIVDRLGDMVLKQDKIAEKLSDGIGSDIKTIMVNTEAVKTDVKTTKEDVSWLKIIWGGLAGVVGLGMVIIEITKMMKGN